MSRNVLLCDDETHILRAAQIKLSRSGYNVTCAHDGQEAWELIQAQVPDILVTDLQMPRMDGLELSRHVRENPATQSLPILVLSAKGFEPAFRDQVAQYGVLAFLPKPFSPRELLACIENVLATGSVGSTPALP